MALLDDKLDPRRVGRGPIGGQELPYKDLNRVSFGRIGDRPIPNAAPGPLSQAAVTPGLLSRLADSVMAKDMPGGGALLNTPRPTLFDSVPGPDWLVKLSPAYARAAAESPEAAERLLAGNKAAPAPVASMGSPSSAAEKPAGRNINTSFVSVAGAPGVSRIGDRKNSPLYTNLDPETAAAQMRGNPIGIIPAGASPFGSSTAGGEVGAALQAAAARGDWDAVRQHYQRNGGTWQGKTAAEETGPAGGTIEWDKYVDADKMRDAQSKLLDTLTNVQPGRSGLSKGQATLLAQLLGQNQQGSQAQAELALRAKQGADSLGIQRGNLDVARQQAGNQTVNSTAQALLAGNQLQDSQEVRALRQQYLSAKTPEEGGQLLQKLLLLQGKDPRQGRDDIYKANAVLVGDLMKAYQSSPIPPKKADGNDMTLDEFVQSGLARAKGVAPAPGPQTLAVGHVADGYRFKGGDPKKESSWEAVK